MYIVKCPDGRRWKVREAVSLKAAINEIAMAMVTGSVGSKSLQSAWPAFTETVIADVVALNSDNTERQPYTMGY